MDGFCLFVCFLRVRSELKCSFMCFCDVKHMVVGEGVAVGS